MNKENNEQVTWLDVAACYYDSMPQQTAFVAGANAAQTLHPGQQGTFGQAIGAMQEGQCVARACWAGMFCYMQVPAELEGETIKKMTSLPDSAKAIVKDKIAFDCQVNIVFLDVDGQGMATDYMPTWLDMLADDWEIYEPED